MNAPPVLAIQPRRLGDLILSFPLFARLRALLPESQLLVCAEPQFYNELAPLAQGITFLPPGELGHLAGRAFAAVINFSQRQDICEFVGKVRANTIIGPAISEGAMRAHGFWQLYRMALTRNNAHNTLHWSDLDCLDLYAGLPLPPVRYSRPQPCGRGIVGLFVGASEPGKRPDALFWARLARRLAKEGYKPIILGGKAEIGIGGEISRHSGPGHVNMCGKQSLGQLAATLQSLDLCITPDTGPMHLANLVGAPVLNLSMGNVHAAETGPASPGQWILRANMSCVGCWQCSRTKFYCKAAFSPMSVFAVADAILRGKNEAETAAALPPGLELARTFRDARGLADIRAINPEKTKKSAVHALDAFWRAAFIHFAFNTPASGIAASAEFLREAHPQVAKSLEKHLGKMLGSFRHCLAAREILPDSFWISVPRHLRLFAGHSQMFLQNSDYSRNAWLQTAERAALLTQCLAG